MQDTRDRNKYFTAEDINTYLSDYSKAIRLGLSKINRKNMVAAQNVLRLTALSGGRIFVGGNGGSAAISDHLKCDFSKGTDDGHGGNLVVHCLSNSMALFSAIGNDLGYERTLDYQLSLSKVNVKDAVILISSSGNSPNITNCCSYAKRFGATVIGLTGFDGGCLKEKCDISLHVPVDNYGVVEDCHQALMHVFAQYYWLSSNER